MSGHMKFGMLGAGLMAEQSSSAEREILAQVTSEIPSSKRVKTTKVMRQRRPITNMQPHKKTAKAS